MGMSTKQKVLRFLSIIWIVGSVLLIVAGIVMALFSGTILTALSQQVPAVNDAVEAAGSLGFLGVFLAVLFVIAGVFDLIVAIFAYRGANDPSKIGVFYVLCIIALITGVLGLVGSLWMAFSSNDWSTIAGPVAQFVWNVICLWLAQGIKDQD